MTHLLARLFPPTPRRPLVPSGIHHRMRPGPGRPTRLHLRVEPSGTGVLIVNASTVLHLNESATVYAWHLVKGSTLEQAAAWMAARFRIGRGRARRDAGRIWDQIDGLAEGGEHDPVLVLGMERSDPLQTRPSAPYRIDLALTYRTGSRSKVDPLARRRVDRELSTDEWGEILRRSWEAGIPHVVFTGGEPTLRPDLPHLVRFAEDLGMVTGLVTRGGRLKDPKAIDDLAQAGLDHFVVSVGPGSKADFEGLGTALDSDVFTSGHLTLSDHRPQELEHILDRIRELGGTHLSITAPPGPEAEALLDRARQAMAERGISLVWDLPVPYASVNPVRLEVEGGVPSGAWMYVEPDGDVISEQASDQVLGNALQDDLLDIWRQGSGSPPAPRS